MELLKAAGSDVADKDYNKWHSWYWRARTNNRWPEDKRRIYDEKKYPEGEVEGEAKSEASKPVQSKYSAPQAGSKITKTVKHYYTVNVAKGRGENWDRVLIAFGENSALKRNAERTEPLAPYTSAEAKEGVQKWSGWRPVYEELKRLGL